MKYPDIWLAYMVGLILLIPSIANANDFHDVSLSYLNGDGYLVEPDQQNTLTFEYASKVGDFDMFLFIDAKSFSGSDNSRYGEFSPRYTLLRFSKEAMIKKISLSATLERGSNDLEANLFGFGLDLNTNAMRYLKFDLYQRDNPDISGKGYQLTGVWGFDSKLGNVPLLIDGYFDWVFSSDESEDNLHFNPQIKIDMQDWFGGSVKWYLGIEYDYWSDKFGIADSPQFRTDQNTWSALIKWHF